MSVTKGNTHFAFYCTLGTYPTALTLEVDSETPVSPHARQIALLSAGARGDMARQEESISLRWQTPATDMQAPPPDRRVWVLPKIAKQARNPGLEEQISSLTGHVLRASSRPAETDFAASGQPAPTSSVLMGPDGALGPQIIGAYLALLFAALLLGYWQQGVITTIRPTADALPRASGHLSSARGTPASRHDVESLNPLFGSSSPAGGSAARRRMERLPAMFAP